MCLVYTLTGIAVYAVDKDWEGWEHAGYFMVIYNVSFCLETASRYTEEAGFELTVILLPLLPEFWEYRQRQFCLTPHIPICSQSVLVLLF